MKAMIFAAGLGTRLKPLTDTMPKALVPVGGKPLIGHVTEKLAEAGFDDIVINVHHFAGMIKNWNGGRYRISDESLELLDTGGGIRHAAGMLRENNAEGRFLIHNVDILSNMDLTSFWGAGEDCDAVLLVSERKTQRYLIFDDDMLLVGWTNIKTGEVRSPYPAVKEAMGNGQYHLYAFAGIHQMKTTMLDDMEEWPDKFPIMDFYLTICSKRRIRGYLQPDLKLMDVGKIDTLAQAEEFQLSCKI